MRRSYKIEVLKAELNLLEVEDALDCEMADIFFESSPDHKFRHLCPDLLLCIFNRLNDFESILNEPFPQEITPNKVARALVTALWKLEDDDLTELLFGITSEYSYCSLAEMRLLFSERSSNEKENTTSGN